MKKWRIVWHHIRISFQKIHLVDKCLLLLMLVLLSQSAYILFTNSGQVVEANHIDIIIRTASASIFGYLLSANFIQHSKATTPTKKETIQATDPLTQNTEQADALQHGIDFVSSDTAANPVSDSANSTTAPPKQEQIPPCARIQIITATVIALFCLLALIFVRDVAGHDNSTNPTTSAVVAQFRDFVSGCVGFLIGCPTPRSSEH